MSTHPETCEIILTAPDGPWFAEFVDMLVSDRLCAAAHRFEPIHTTYWWRGQLHRKAEIRVSLHTRRSLVDAVVARTQREHPYEVPAVAVLPIVTGNPDYLEWILAETAAQHRA